jgi:integrase/recombinase XerD
MQEVLRAFFDHLGADGTTPPNTLTAYRTDLRQFAAFLADCGITDVQAIQLDDMQAFCAWLEERGYAKATVARRVTALRAFGGFLVQTAVLASNPAQGLQVPAPPRLVPRVLTPQQVDALRTLTVRRMTPDGWRDRVLLEVLAATALRVSEVVAIDLDDIDVLSASVRVRRRNGSDRQVTLSADAVMAIVTYLQLGRPNMLPSESTESALLLNCHGQRLTRQGVWAILQRYARQLQLDELSPEVLRQSAAVHRLAAGASVDEVRALLGHSTQAATLIYQHAVRMASA